MTRTHHALPPAAERRAPSPAVLTVESIAAGGDGVSRANGLVIFTPRTAPGDVADVDVTPSGRFGRGTLRALLTASPDRVEPACAHYTRDRCGGCQLQHLSIEAQREAKSRIVADALRRIGHREGALPPVRFAGEPWRYRRKLTLAIRRRGHEWFAGLHPHDAPGRVFPLDDCPITDERVVALWRVILAAADDLPDARELRGAVRVDDHDASFSLEGGSSWPRSGAFFARVPALGAIWWTPEQSSRRRLHAREGAAAPGASFTQVNAAMAAELQTHVMARVAAHAPRTLIDAYAGTGDTAAAAAAQGAQVTAIELDEDAAAWCAARLPAGARAIAARVEDVLGTLLPADVVVLNPPRAGVDPRVTAALAGERGVRAIVYVSCDPATLARDLARLPAWRVASIECFDMFPQTAHVETVCELVPEAA